MKVIICVDDKFGMMFNKRRQSRDAKVIEDILNITEKLWIHPFSEKLFLNHLDSVIVEEDFLEKAGQNDYCFVENQNIAPYRGKINELVVYYWNRTYPSDLRLELDVEEWQLIERIEFTGSSHEKITREIRK